MHSGRRELFGLESPITVITQPAAGDLRYFEH
jgi:hypothetical protein